MTLNCPLLCLQCPCEHQESEEATGVTVLLKTILPDVVLHTCNLSSQDVETVNSQIQSQPEPHNKFQVRLSMQMTSCLKRPNKQATVLTLQAPQRTPGFNPHFENANVRKRKWRSLSVHPLNARQTELSAHSLVLSCIQLSTQAILLPWNCF